MAADADEQSSAEEGRAGLNGHADVQGNADNSNIAPWPGATYSSPSELSGEFSSLFTCFPVHP